MDAPPTDGGRGAAGALAAGAAAVGAGLAAPGPPAGIAGSLIVGDAVGFGGKEIRTVSFLGATLEASEGFGGKFSFSSAISNEWLANVKLCRWSVKPLISNDNVLMVPA